MSPEKKAPPLRFLFLLMGGIGALSVLGGCATPHQIRFHDKDQASMNGDTSVRVLYRAADRISRDWDRLLSYQSHLPPAALGISRIQRSGTMGRRFTMKYVGPIQPFLSKIGKTVRWNVKVVGQKPAMQPMIEIRARKEYLYDILRDAGVQVSPSAWIVLRPEGREIDLIYPPPLPSKRSERRNDR